MLKDALTGCCWFVIGFLDLAAVTDLAGQFHDGEKEVGKQAQMAVELLKQMKLFVGVVAVIANSLADDGVIFLFDEAAIVFAIGSTAGKGDLMVDTVAVQFFVDKFAAVV